MIALVLLLAGGGAFWFIPHLISLGAGQVKGSPDDYVVREVGQERIVENKRAGLTVEVPDGWIIEKMDIEQGSMVFYSPDAQGIRPGKVRPPLKKGCMIETAVGYHKMDIEGVRREIRAAHEELAMKIDEFEVLEINGFQVLKNTNDCIELGPSIAAYIPNGDRLLGASVFMSPKETDQCSQEFDKFLETVKIE